MTTKAEIQQVAKRVTPTPIWNIARQFLVGQKRHGIEQDEVPEHLLRNHRVLAPDKAFMLEDSIRTHYHQGWRAEEKYLPSVYRKDLEDHLYNRIRDDRQRIIPWLDQFDR